MSTIYLAENLRYLRKLKGLTQAEIPAQLNIPRTTWASYEAAQASPQNDVLVRIADFFNVSVDDILRVKLSEGNLIKDENSENTGEIGNLNSNPKGNPNALNTVLPQGGQVGQITLNVYDLNSQAAAGMAMLLEDGDRLKTAPNLHLPNLGMGMHIRIPVRGDSMHPTIKDGDKVVATRVSDLSQIRSGNIYIVIDEEEGTLCKRVYPEGDALLELVSDNPTYKPVKIPLSRVSAIFHVQEVHSTDLRNYESQLRADVDDLKGKFIELQRRLDK